LKLPVVHAAEELSPTPELLLPVVTDAKEAFPIAVFDAPVVSEVSVKAPKPELNPPPVDGIRKPARYPRKVSWRFVVLAPERASGPAPPLAFSQV
jgi:hypothetical protein